MVLFVSGCSKENLDSKQIADQNEGSGPRKSGADGIYDVLGYGYDATGLYMNSYSSTHPVIDMVKFKASEPNNINIDNSTSTEGTYASGSNAETYAKSLTASLEISYTGLFYSGQVKTSYSISNTTTSKFSYASYNMLLRMRRITLNSSVDNFTNYLSDQFIADLNTQSAEYIVLNYGTHVLTEVQLGAKLELSYQSNASGVDKNETVKAGLVASAGKSFKVTADVSVNSSLKTNNSSESIKYKTFGGDVSKAIVGTIILNTNSQIDISSWQSSCNTTNMVLINVAPKKMIYIYELVKDPTKRAAIKLAVEKYISGRSIICATDLLECKKSGSYGVDYQYSTVPNNYIGWTSQTSIGFLLPETTLRVGTIPLYQFYRRVANSAPGVVGGYYSDQYILTTNLNEGTSTPGATLVRTEGQVYATAVDNSVTPLYQFYNVSTKMYTYSTNKLQFGNGTGLYPGADNFIYQKIVCYIPK